MSDKIEFRPFQEDFIKSALENARSRVHSVVGNIAPGSGKTLSALAAADRLFKEGYINQVVIFVPRTNLAVQYEQDWNKFRSLLRWSPSIRDLHHRGNTTPLVRGNEDGYITTYDSLTSDPQIHLAQIRSKRTLVIFDECQQLGIDEKGNATQSAHSASDAGRLAEMVFVLSGTPYRADGKPLAFARYDAPDAQGYRRLLSDVEVTYLQGVRDGYLRPFEALLHDGFADWQTLEGEERHILSKMEKSIYKVIRQAGYWKPFVDRVVSKLNEVKTHVHPGLRGLIAAYDQTHAKEIYDYISKKHKTLRVVVAVSDDGTEAQDALRKFRDSKEFDLLITVNMAYVGYDCKWISVVGILTGTRTEAYLRQLIARGLRVSPEIETHLQHCYTIAPSDPRMVEFTKRLRQESCAGLEQREEKEMKENREKSDSQLSLDSPVYAELDKNSIHAVGNTNILPSGDYKRVEEIKAGLNISIPATLLFTAIQQYHSEPAAEAVPSCNESPFKTQREREKDRRALLSKMAAKCDSLLGNEFGTTNKVLFDVYGNEPVSSATMDGIEERIKTVQRWIENAWYDRKR